MVGWGSEAELIYDKLTVALLGTLSTERWGSTNAHIARYLLERQGELGDLSVKAVASACGVGAGSVSRFCREVGFDSFDELRREFCTSARSYETVPASDAESAAGGLAGEVARTLLQVERTIDRAAVARLVSDLRSHEHVSVYGMLKAQAAAVDLQVDLLMQDKYVDTCVSHAEQLSRIANATADELVVVFSYTGSYFDSRDLSNAMQRVDRPKIWVVCGKRHQMPPFVADRVLFSSSGSQVGHPYQLELAAGIIAQTYAREGA